MAILKTLEPCSQSSWSTANFNSFCPNYIPPAMKYSIFFMYWPSLATRRKFLCLLGFYVAVEVESNVQYIFNHGNFRTDSLHISYFLKEPFKCLSCLFLLFVLENLFPPYFHTLLVFIIVKPIPQSLVQTYLHIFFVLIFFGLNHPSKCNTIHPSFFLLVWSPWPDSLLVTGWFFQAQNSGYPVTILCPYS